MNDTNNIAAGVPSDQMRLCYPEDMLNCWSPDFLRYRGMEHKRGWLGLVVGLHFRLRFLVGDYTIYQVKEKFGALRYYCDAEQAIPDVLPDSDDLRERVRRLIADAEHRSGTICEVCGHSGMTINRRGWLATRCGSCRDAENNA